MKYVLLFAETEQYAEDWEALSEAEKARAKQAVDRWFAEHGARIRAWGRLQSPHTATTLRMDGGEPLITDGPFVEGKEVVSGYVEIEAADLDEALGIARSWPACRTVEIRPLADVEVPLPRA